jgi:hypothetical protein
MRHALAALLLTVAATDARAQQCRADFDASGAVEIGEVIQAVNEALNGCGRPTPTVPLPTLNCPVRFTGNNTADEQPACVFRLTSGTCRTVEYRFFTDGTNVIVELGTDPVGYYSAKPSGPLSGTITGRWSKADVSDFRATSGTLSLTSGNTLVFDPSVGLCGRMVGRWREQVYPSRGYIRAMLAALRAR